MAGLGREEEGMLCGGWWGVLGDGRGCGFVESGAFRGCLKWDWGGDLRLACGLRFEWWRGWRGEWMRVGVRGGEARVR